MSYCAERKLAWTNRPLCADKAVNDSHAEIVLDGLKFVEVFLIAS